MSTDSTKQTTLQWRSIVFHYWQALRHYLPAQAWLLSAWGIGALLTTLVSPLLVRRIIDTAAEGGPEAYGIMQESVLLLAGAIVLYNALFRFADYHMIRSQSMILKDLHDYAHRKLHDKSYEFFTNTFAGSLIAKTRRFVNGFETLHDLFVFQLWLNGLSLVIAFGVLWYESWILGTIVLVWFAAYILLVSVLIRYQLPKSLKEAEADSATTAHYSDIISNVLTVKMFARSSKEIASFEETTARQERTRRSAWMQHNLWNNLYQGAMIGIFEVTIMWTVVYLWNEGVVTGGTILLVQVYVIVIFDVVWQIGRNVTRGFTALSDANEMAELLDRPAEVTDPIDPEPVRFNQGTIDFDQVRHRYNGDSVYTFDGLSLSIPRGQRVALVGHSGAGKTTVVKLLLRFLDIDEGTITIDGQDITHVTQDDLRKHIAYVPQEPVLFHRTLFENIAYADEDPNAQIDVTREEVIAAAKRAHAHDFIERLPNGYDTLVGERGIKLSGGERQRVAIARAMLKRAPVVILDEATSSLDSVSERHIQAGFDALMEGRTTIVIAHRLSTIQHMDRIIVLEQGAIVEDGTHDELLAKDGIYANLWQSQVGGFLLDAA